MPRQAQRFSIHGLSLAALEWPGEGLPVIALHGWLDNAASFIPLAPWLEGVHLLAPDLVGHGHSDHLPASAGYHLADNCRWVISLADAMGWERFVLMGHSMGAAAASITAAAAPDRLAGLILLDGLCPIALTPQQEVARLQQLFTTNRGRKSSRTFRDLESVVKLRQRLGRFPIGTEAAMTITRRGMAEVEGGFCWRHDERLQEPSTHYYTAEQSEGILQAIESHTLLISASDGAFSGWGGLAQRAQCIRQLQHVSLTGGHHLHMEASEKVAEEINGFLSNLNLGEVSECFLSN